MGSLLECLKERLRDRYTDIDRGEINRQKLSTRHQGEKQSVAEYTRDFDEYAAWLAYTHV